MSDTFLIRDVFNPQNVTELGKAIFKEDNTFDHITFTDEILSVLPNLSYKERSDLITNSLEKHLKNNYLTSLNTLLKTLPPPIGAVEIASLERFILLPISMYIARNGMDYFEESMEALKAITIRFTSEFAIRFFIQSFPTQSLNLLTAWAKDPNPHVRRLVSEGSRPRLPWGLQLKLFVKEPHHTLQLLELLKDDESLYVRRSVANHINDIAKNHPTLVLSLLKEWKTDATPERLWIIKHASRTLIKKGYPEALALQGTDIDAVFEITSFEIDKNNLALGEKLEFILNFKNTSEKNSTFTIDYVVNYQKSNGKMSPKVFKWTVITLAPNETITLKKAQIFKDFTTRKHYAGMHEIGLQINGKTSDFKEFTLAIK